MLVFGFASEAEGLLVLPGGRGAKGEECMVMSGKRLLRWLERGGVDGAGCGGSEEGERFRSRFRAS
jgi:hypothetical protein